MRLHDLPAFFISVLFDLDTTKNKWWA